MKKLLFTFIFFLLPIHSWAMTLTAEVDRQSIGLQETLQLNLTFNRQGANLPDLSALELQFDILRQHQRSQTTIVNGKISAYTQWSFILAPKESGDLIIPSLSTMGAYSEAITIRVTDNANNGTSAKNSSASSFQDTNKQSTNSSNNSPSTNTNQPQNIPPSAIYLEAVVDKHKVYVQEQILLSLRLYYRLSLSGYTPQELTVDNSTVELTAENNFQKNINGVLYNVLERVYAIHPQASGTLTIPEQIWQVEKVNNRLGFTSGNSPYLRLRSREKNIEVLPIPGTSTAIQWLPAESVTMEQEWQQSLVTAKVGEPLTYTITTTAKGLHHAQLPSLKLDSNDYFTIYSDQAKTENAVSVEGITGKQTVNYAVIPTQAGTFTLPLINLTWWNVSTDKEETITLKPQQIIVANSELSSQTELPESHITTPQKISNSHSSTLWLWPLSALFFAILALIFFVLWQKSKNANNDPSLINDQNNTGTKQAPTLKALYASIEQAILHQKWLELKQLLLQWATNKTQQSINNSDALASYFPEIKETIQLLDKHLYSHADTSKESQSTPLSEKFFSLIDLLKQQEVNTSNDKKKRLTDLYPH